MSDSVLFRASILVAATQVLMLLVQLATGNPDVVSLLGSLSPWLAGHAISLAWIANAIVVISVLSVPLIEAVDPDAEGLARRLQPVYGVWIKIVIACLIYLFLLAIVGSITTVASALSN